MTAVISNNELQAIQLLELNTGAVAKDAVFTDSSIIFVVKAGDLGKAIGKQGKNVVRMKQIFSRDVHFVEEASELRFFVANLFAPAPMLEVKQGSVEGKKSLLVKVEAKNKGLAIGSRGEKINRARLLLKRHYGIDEVKIV